MNADSKASIHFEAFFFGREDFNNDNNLSVNAMCGYRILQTGRKCTPQNFDMGFENVV